jgi:hypothetical protein
LKEQPNYPKHRKSQANLPAQWRIYQVLGTKKAQKTHQKNGQCNEKSMHFHHLPIDERKRF